MTIGTSDDDRARARQALADALAGVAAGDRSAFAEVYLKSSGKLFGICLRILGDKSDAEDVLQEIYVNVWNGAHRFDAARSSPISWLSAIARNRAIDRLRARRSRPAGLVNDDPDRRADDSPLADVLVERAQEAERLSRCLDQLEERQSGAIRRAFFTGATYSDLARSEDVPLGTMKSWIRRSLLRLRDCLER